MNVGKQFIWYNKEFGTSSFYSRNLLDAGIWTLNDAFDTDGNFLSYDILYSRGVTNFLSWCALKSILKKHHLKNVKDNTFELESMHLEFYYNEKMICLQTCNSRIIYSCLRDNVHGSHIVKPKCHILFDESIDYGKIYQNYYANVTDTQSKVFQYKFLNNFLVNNYWLKKWGIQDENICTFCKSEVETQIHLFWDCVKVKEFWATVSTWLSQKQLNPEITKVMVFLGLETFETKDIILLLAKQYIHNTMYKNNILNIRAFTNYLNYYRNLEYNVAVKQGKVEVYLEKWRYLLY